MGDWGVTENQPAGGIAWGFGTSDNAHSSWGPNDDPNPGWNDGPTSNPNPEWNNGPSDNVDSGWVNGPTAGVDQSMGVSKPEHKAFEPESSANPKENIGRATESRWLQPADKLAGDRADEMSRTGENSQQVTEVMTALARMQMGNGSGYVAPRPEWAAAASKYEWKDEYGDVGPEVPELEKMLYNDAFLNKSGQNFNKMSGDKVQVTVESEKQISPMFEWEDAGLHPVMLDNVKKCGYEMPTAVQGYCIPAVLAGHDVIAIAQTGSGKTAAYLVPTLSKLMGKIKKLGAARPRITKDYDPLFDGVRAEPLVLVIVPTRELAIQIFDEARRLCYRSMLRPCVAYGGGPMHDQMDDLRKGCDILIASPGRLIDFMGRPSLLSLHRARYTIIDEADEMIGPDWEETMDKILSGADRNQDGDHHYMMFSATFPRDARALAKRHLSDDHVRIRVGRVGATHKHLAQQIVWVEESAKNQACFDLLVAMPPTRTIIFVNGRNTCDSVDDFLFNCGLPSTSLHSERSQSERESAIHAFRAGTAPIMVATGISSRGLDFFNVMHIINYDLPSTSRGGIHEYVHRIGRTARIGNLGTATSFYNDRNDDIAQDLVNNLVECEQVVPDFLQHLKPADGEEPDFAEDDSANEDGEDTSGAVDDGWGTTNGGEAANSNNDNAWGNGADNGGW